MFFSSFPNLPLLFLPSDLSSLPLLIYLLFCSPLPIFFFPPNLSLSSSPHSSPILTPFLPSQSFPSLPLSFFSSSHLSIFLSSSSSLPFLSQSIPSQS